MRVFAQIFTNPSSQETTTTILTVSYPLSVRFQTASISKTIHRLLIKANNYYQTQIFVHNNNRVRAAEGGGGYQHKRGTTNYIQNIVDVRRLGFDSLSHSLASTKHHHQLWIRISSPLCIVWITVSMYAHRMKIAIQTILFLAASICFGN